ncbi:hypothetical protein NE236_18580 [Actinoallomurus purpureus]|uniref:hypothetical protein n=1 Tax=Actinoallomurus purpureus TaxID=478114 RepID=UPI0020937D6F|nr:hypothetical protein [Actinoallomurus purpureus]MCO6006997.1 hypothetical protein [Actinoallomurus purpureus]
MSTTVRAERNGKTDVRFRHQGECVTLDLADCGDRTAADGPTGSPTRWALWPTPSASGEQ